MTTDQKHSEIIAELSRKTGVSEEGVNKIMLELGLKESLEERLTEDKKRERYGLPASSSQLGNITVQTLRIASGELSI